ncbi:unnamed protein product [Prorocentrum cordatum]|uniref:Uncharacterized protein n=1 Tax=Prorocentrum cordatum TaxID=2364126 RepID=A0ABN9PXT0_9DINO|nr:unnamed protein product [Polarella glacialis]
MLATRACGSQAVRWQTLSKFLMRRARRRRRTGGRRRRRGRRGGLARRIDKSSIDETLARTGTPGPRACLGNGRTDMRPKKRGKPATALCAAVGACRALVRGLFVHCALVRARAAQRPDRRTAPGRARRKGLTARTGGRWRGCLKRSSSRPKRRRRAQEPITRRSQHAGAGGS